MWHNTAVRKLNYIGREKKLECRGEKPLEILTIMKVLNKNLNNEEYYQIA